MSKLVGQVQLLLKQIGEAYTKRLQSHDSSHQLKTSYEDTALLKKMILQSPTVGTERGSSQINSSSILLLENRSQVTVQRDSQENEVASLPCIKALIKKLKGSQMSQIIE